jgi:hypothetical protein
MITETGKEIIAKYLMGLTPAYASYIAIGCGAKPRPNVTQITGVSSSGTTITCASTSGLWVGAILSQVTVGTGVLATNTAVVTIISGTQFTVDQAPTTPLSSATVSIKTDNRKTVLDFETLRIPISSRGYINDNGINKIVFTGELPTEERYEISEIAIYSAGSNPSAASFDSRALFTFTDAENWQYNDGTTLSAPTSILSSLTDGSNNITSVANAIQTTANNTAFLNATRAGRYERCRYFNNVIMLRGNTSHLSSNTGVFTVGSNPKLLQLTGQTFNFSQNSPSDLIKIAFSIVNVTGGSGLSPDKARVLIEFSNTDGTQYARFNGEALNSTFNFNTNRYMVVKKRLDELTYSATFSWQAMSIVKIYVSALYNLTITNKAADTTYVTLTTSSAHNLSAGDNVLVAGIDSRCNGQFVVFDTPTPTTFRYANAGTTLSSTAVSPNVVIEASLSSYFIALDAIRFDNVGTINPLYGMTGYSIVQNSDAATVVKSSNSNNYVEFRVVVDVT